MASLRRHAVGALPVWLLLVAAGAAQQRGMHIGYVYPAGGQQGTTFEAVIAGQFLAGVDRVFVSGGGVEVKLRELVRPMSGKELNTLRIELDELMARRAVARKDFRALENFLSFRNAKSIKPDPAAREKEIEALKQKYAGATWTAEDEKRLAAIRQKIARAVRRPANPAISELVIAEITIAPDAKPGVREVRVGNPSTLSNPLVFHVGALPEFSEPPSKTITEQRSTVARTAVLRAPAEAEPEMQITLPAVVNGQILPGDVDRYRFPARKGQRLVIAASARQLIPYLADAVPGWFQATLALYDSKGAELAYTDDYRFNPDPVLFFEVPADGQYVVEIKDAIYRGREDFVYRIIIGELPWITSIFPLGGPAGQETTVELRGWNLPLRTLAIDNRQRSAGIYPLFVGQAPRQSNAVPFAVDTLPECLENEPNNTQERAHRVGLPVIVNGRIDSPGDVDVFAFEGRAGSTLVAEVMARRLDSPLDSLLRLTDASGKELAANDDHEDKGAGLITHQADSYLSVTLPSDGVYYLALRDAQGKGGTAYGYRLRIGPPRPDFALRVVPASLNVRAGVATPLTVYALRRDGFSGEITVDLKDAPPVFRLSGNVIAAGQDQVRMTLTAYGPPDAQPFTLPLEGRATIGDREVVHPVVPAEDMMQAFAYHHLVPAQELKVVVTGRAAPKAGGIRLLSKTPLRIPAGGTASAEIAVPATAMLSRVRLDLSDPPEGISIKSVSESRNGATIVFACDAGKIKPGTKGNLIVVASARRPAAGSKTKAKPGARAGVLATLPAIPYVVVAPAKGNPE